MKSCTPIYKTWTLPMLIVSFNATYECDWLGVAGHCNSTWGIVSWTQITTTCNITEMDARPEFEQNWNILSCTPTNSTNYTSSVETCENP